LNPHVFDILSERRHIVPIIIISRELVCGAQVDEIEQDCHQEDEHNEPK
jgi:hypothetical protein